MASLSTKQGQPSTYSPGTLASSRRRLGNFLSGIVNLGSPLKSSIRPSAVDSSVPIEPQGDSPLKAKVYRRGKDNDMLERTGRDQDDLWPVLSGKASSEPATEDTRYEEGIKGINKRDVSVIDSAVDISANEVKRSYLLELPDDLILTIFQHLPLSPQQLRTLSLSSHRLRSISQSPILWSQLYHSTPGYILSPLVRDRLVAVSDPPRGNWAPDGTDWIWDEPLPDINQLSLSSSNPAPEKLSSGRIPVHYPTLYRSRTALSYNIRHPSPVHRTKTEIVSEHTDAVYSIRSSGQWVFTGSRDKSIRIWRIGSFDEYGQRGQTVLIKNIPDAHTGSVLCLSVDIDLAGKGQMISGSSDHTTRLWSVDLSDPSSPQISLESTLRGHDLAVLDVALTPEYIITASKDTTVRVCSRSTLQLKHVWEDHERAVNAIAVSPDERSVVSASGSGMWIVRDLDGGEMVRKGGGKQGQLGGVACIAWKGDYIVTGSSDRKVTIYDANSRDPTSTEVIKICVGHTDMVRAVDINLEEGWVVSGSYDGSVRLWDLRTGILMRNFSMLNGSFVFDVQSTLTRLFVCVLHVDPLDGCPTEQYV